jgi:anaerobic magnesium-protoporphyrin IX monomethyl ester cyclase
MKALLCTVPLDIGVLRNTGELPIMPKIAIVSLIKWMERNGFTADEYDFFDIDMLDSSDEEIREYLEKTKPDVIGLSATVSTTYLQVMRLAKIAREVCPNAWIVQGGGMAVSANVILRKTPVDICFQSDGEIPWVEFLNYVKAHGRSKVFAELEKIKGLTYLDANGEMHFTGFPEKIPGSEMPYPDYEILALGLKTKPETFQNYFRPDGHLTSWFKPDPRTKLTKLGRNVASLWTTKGCVARCTFCQRSTKGYVTKNVTTLDEHLEILKDKYGVGFIHILDENFGSDKKHARAVAETMKKHGMFWIASGVRCISVQKEDAQFYFDHNCSALKFGVESGSQKILDLMEKRFTVEQVYEAVKSCYELGMYSPLAVMAGMPGEDDQTAMETGRYLGKMARMIGTPPGELGIAIFHALPLPGTPLYQYGQQTGMIGTSVEDEEKYLIAISDRGSEKDNFINLNGSPIKDVIFWEFLMRYEATRTYFEKPLGNDCVTHQLNVGIEEGKIATDIHGTQHSDELREMNKLYPALGSLTNTDIQATRHKTKVVVDKALSGVRFFNPKFIAWFLHYHSSNLITLLNYKLVFKPWTAKVPRWILYPVMKTLLYLEFVYRKSLRKLYRLFGLPVKERNLFNDFNFPKPILNKDIEIFENRIEKSLRNIVKINRDKSFIPASISDANRELLNQGR